MCFVFLGIFFNRPFSVFERGQVEWTLFYLCFKDIVNVVTMSANNNNNNNNDRLTAFDPGQPG